MPLSHKDPISVLVLINTMTSFAGFPQVCLGNYANMAVVIGKADALKEEEKKMMMKLEFPINSGLNGLITKWK